MGKCVFRIIANFKITLNLIAKRKFELHKEKVIGGTKIIRKFYILVLRPLLIRPSKRG
jgi:hypothetical protein